MTAYINIVKPTQIDRSRTIRYVVYVHKWVVKSLCNRTPTLRDTHDKIP